MREDGTVKVLDFGLAKALDTTPQGDPSQSPTLTAAATQMGVIMGTAAYMSPEQARGKPVDKRADIWAFGSVLFEMLTGQRPFVGDDATDILAAVVRAEPEWNRLPPHLDPRLKGLIERCLEKDVRLRWHDVGDVRVDITKVEDNLEESAVTLNADQANWSDPYRRLGIAFVAGALLAGLTAWNLAPQGAGDSRMVRLSLDVLSSQEDAIQAGVVGTIAISADGARVAYVARGSVTAEPGSEPRRLYVRTLAEDQATAVSGTEGATNAFFSPDGTWVGFFAGGELQIAPVAGGAPLSVANANQVFGAAWGPNDTIVFGGGTGSGLWQVPAAGGAPEPLTSLDADKGEILHGLPEFLPDGETVLFTTGTSTGSRIAMLSLQTGAWEDLALSGAGARYVSDGYLVFSEEDSLRLFGFDAERKEVTGSVTPVQDGVQWETWAGLQLSSFATSRRGDLMFISGSQEFAQTRLVWVDRDGQETSIETEAGFYLGPRISPGPSDRIAVVRLNEFRLGEVWVMNADGSQAVPVANDGADYNPAWSPDGRTLTYTSNGNIYELAARGESHRIRSIARSDHAYSTDAHGHGQTTATSQADVDVGRRTRSASQRRAPVLHATESHSRESGFRRVRRVALSAILRG